MKRVQLVFFLASLCFACFCYGVAVMRLKIFPYRLINQAEEAARALNDVYSGSSDAFTRHLNAYVRRSPGPVVGTGTRWLTESRSDEWVLLVGDPGLRATAEFPEGCLACVIDRNGRLMHQWRASQVKLREAAFAGTSMINARIFPVAAHLWPNGDLLLTLQGFPSTPYGIALLKLDRDSNIIWVLARNAHHWFSIDVDGVIYVPGQREIEAPRKLGDSRAYLTAAAGRLLEDTIQVISPDGQLLEEFSLVDVLVESGLLGIFRGETNKESIAGDEVRLAYSLGDPLHLNGIHLVRESEATPEGPLNAGDLIVSLRSVNALLVIERQSRKVKWFSMGTVVQQHSPVPWQGGLLVLDNRGGAVRFGGTRLAKIDLNSRLSSTVFPRPDSKLPETFDTWRAGHLELDPSGRRALIASTYQGVVWEVELNTGAVLWESIAVNAIDASRRVRVQQASYVPEGGVFARNAHAADETLSALSPHSSGETRD